MNDELVTAIHNLRSHGREEDAIALAAVIRAEIASAIKAAKLDHDGGRDPAE